MMARLGAQHLLARLGQSFVVENRPSAGGALAAGQVAAAAPDGYTLMFSASSMVNLTPQLQKLGFDPVKQLVPITNMGTGTQVIAIKRDLPVQNPAGVPGPREGQSRQAELYGRRHAEHQPSGAGAVVCARRRRAGDGAGQGRPAGGVRSHGRPGRSLFRQCVGAAAAHQQRPDPADRRRHGATARRRARPADGCRDAAGLRVLLLERLLCPGRNAGARSSPPSATRSLRFAKSPEISGRLSKLGIVPGGLSRDETEAVFRKDREALAAAIKAAGIRRRNSE